MVVDALLLCFCEDSQINDGSEDRPYYMNTSLRVISPFDCKCMRIIIAVSFVYIYAFSALTLLVGRQ